MNNQDISGNEIDYEEVDLIYKLLVSRYSNLFTEKRAYDVSILLYNNGIRSYMFDVELFDMDEIVKYIANRDKIIIFSKYMSRNFYDESIKEGRVINFMKGLIRKRGIKIRKEK